MSTENSILQQIFSNKNNYLIHGPGGTGKSYILQKIFNHSIKFRKTHITATTGIAAINIKGTTFHSFAGIGIGNKSSDELIVKVKTNYMTAKRWREAELLIIDEISMFGKNLFDKVDKIAKSVRGSDLPFGGLRLILSGDFLQLPPVNDDWIFKSQAWKNLDLKIINLIEPKRFTNLKYTEFLYRARTADLTEPDVDFLIERFQKYKELKKSIENPESSGKTSGKLNTKITKAENEIIPTILYSKKLDVSLYNKQELEKIKLPAKVYKSKDTFVEKKDPKVTKTLLGSSDGFYKKILEDAIEENITLKVGAQVMLKANLDLQLGLVNGSRGVVTDICDNSVVVKFEQCTQILTPHNWEVDLGHVKLFRSQIPLILAYALTIHKTQGCTIDKVIVDLGTNIFECGQAYVALSRVRCAEGLFLSALSKNSIKVNTEALNYVRTFS